MIEGHVPLNDRAAENRGALDLELHRGVAACAGLAGSANSRPNATATARACPRSAGGQGYGVDHWRKKRNSGTLSAKETTPRNATKSYRRARHTKRTTAMTNNSKQPEGPDLNKLARQRLITTYVALFSIAAICTAITYRLKATGVDMPAGTTTGLICSIALYGVPALHSVLSRRFLTVHHFIFTSVGVGVAGMLAMLAIISRYT